MKSWRLTNTAFKHKAQAVVVDTVAMLSFWIPTSTVFLMIFTPEIISYHSIDVGVYFRWLTALTIQLTFLSRIGGLWLDRIRKRFKGGKN